METPDTVTPNPPTDTPVDAAEATNQKELEAARAEAAEYKDLAQRTRAEFANYKKRVEREQAETYQNAAARILARYLDVVDDFDRAIKGQPSDNTDAAGLAQWANGVGMIHRKFKSVLEAEGMARIEAEGQPFDPALHEAVLHEDSDEHPSGHVVEVLRQGYKLGDRVVRPALVKVAR